MMVFRRRTRPLESDFADLPEEPREIAIQIVRDGPHMVIMDASDEERAFLERCGYRGVLVCGKRKTDAGQTALTTS